MIIPQGVWDVYNTTASDFISSNFGVPCKLIYGDNRTECPNCIYDTITKTSSNQYKAGGPQEFSQMICPYCDGVGYILTQHSETIKMRVYFSKKDFIRVEIPVTVTNSIIQTIAFIEDLPKLQQCREMIANTDVQNLSIYKFDLAGEIMPWGLGPVKKFCVAFWKRTQ